MEKVSEDSEVVLRMPALHCISVALGSLISAQVPSPRVFGACSRGPRTIDTEEYATNLAPPSQKHA